MADEGEFPKIDGDIFYGSEATFTARPVQEVYTGTDFNSSQSGSGSDEQSHELTAVSSANAAPAKYVKIKITGTSNCTHATGTSSSASTSLRAQIKETGDSYADIVSNKKILNVTKAFAGTLTNNTTCTYTIISELTSGMKTNGFQIKVLSTSASTNASNSCSFSNVQTIQELA